MSTKSQGRNAFVERFPSTRLEPVAELDALQTAARSGTLIVVDDALVFERSWTPPPGATGADLVARTRTRIQEACARTYGPGCTYVVLYDKQRFVPVAKGVEQSARSSTQSKAGTGAEALPADTELALNRPLPQPYAAMFNDRHVLRPRVLRFLTAHLCATLVPPEGTRIVFDGHCLSPAQARAQSVVVREQQQMAPDDDSMPIVLMRMEDASSGMQTLATYCPQLRNELGEADVAAFWHATRFAVSAAVLRQPSSTLLVRSVDSDFAYLAMLHAVRHQQRCRVLVEFASRGGNGNSKNQSDWLFDANAACRVIEAHCSRDAKLLRWPVHALCAAMWSAGCDYVDAFPSVTHATFFEAWLNNAAAIGDLVDEQGELDARAYVRLVVAAHVAKHKLRPLGTDERYAVWRARLLPAQQTRCPEPDALRTRAMNTHYVTHMAAQTSARLELLPPLDCGYALIDAGAPLSAANIRWAHDSRARK